VTIDKSITWRVDDPVSLNYAGTSPDIGAFEFVDSGDASAPIPPQNVKLQSP
jgi:hypothetical protein